MLEIRSDDVHDGLYMGVTSLLALLGRIIHVMLAPLPAKSHEDSGHKRGYATCIGDHPHFQKALRIFRRLPLETTASMMGIDPAAFNQLFPAAVHLAS